jgi:hypothetical protein
VPAGPLTYRQWRRTAEAQALFRERRDLIVLLYNGGVPPAQIRRAGHLPADVVDRELAKAGVKRWQRAS